MNRKQVNELLDRLRDIDACMTSLEWVSAKAPDAANAQQLWDACLRSSWLMFAVAYGHGPQRAVSLARELVGNTLPYELLENAEPLRNALYAVDAWLAVKPGSPERDVAGFKARGYNSQIRDCTLTILKLPEHIRGDGTVAMCDALFWLVCSCSDDVHEAAVFSGNAVQHLQDGHPEGTPGVCRWIKKQVPLVPIGALG